MPSEHVDVATAEQMWKAGDAVIDVRSAEEYAEGHVAGAVNIPLDTLVKADLPDGPILTACTMGGRAAKAADRLSAMGREAFVIEGGTKAWQGAGLPVVTGSSPR